MLQEKRINRLKLAVTTDCNLACAYCFVKHNKDKIRRSDAYAAVDLLLGSPGLEKELSLYGGEPLLHFSLVRDIVLYGRRCARKMGKRLTIDICTNLLLMDERKLKFLKAHGVRVTVSILGRPGVHDKARMFPGGRGTHAALLYKIGLLLRSLPTENVCAAFCVLPSGAKMMKDNWDYLINLGFRHFHLEIIRSSETWTPKRLADFGDGFGEVMVETLRRIGTGDRVHFDLLDEEIRHGVISDPSKTQCPFVNCLEVYPQGQIAFSPFLLNMAQASRYLIGTVKAVMPRFAECTFRKDALVCRGCVKEYFSGIKFRDGADAVCDRMQKILGRSAVVIRAAHQHRAYRDYLALIRQKGLGNGA